MAESGPEKPREKPARSEKLQGARQVDVVTAALRQLHNAVVQEPVPEAMLRILDEIDKKNIPPKRS